jgi:hypothetical protein
MAPVFRIRHPDDPRRMARYGHDEHGGYRAELTAGVVCVRYDVGSVAYDTDEPLSGLLMFLAHHGFVGADDVDAALGWADGRDPGSLGRARRAPGRVRRVLLVIARLSEAGG